MSFALLTREGRPTSRTKAAYKCSYSSDGVGESSNASNHRADDTVHQTLAEQKSKPEWSLSNVSIKAPLRRKRARERSGDSVAAGIPAVVNEVLSSSGRPLDREVHSAMEAGFGANMNTVGAVSPTFSGIGVSRPSDPAEKEADRTASLLVANAVAPRGARGEGVFNMVRSNSETNA